VIHQQFKGQADIINPLGLIDKDCCGISHDPLQVLQFMLGEKRLSVEIVASKRNGVWQRFKELFDKGGLTGLSGTIENQSSSRLTEAFTHLLSNGAWKHLAPQNNQIDIS
jgi:hypothetical protein